MRYEEAKSFLAFVDEHGIGLERGELDEVQEAELRVYGPAILPRVEIPKVEGSVTVAAVRPWEEDVLVGVAHELMETLLSEGEEVRDGR